MSRYYLNNMTDTELTISLSAIRVIKPLTSLPLNDKDVEIYNALKLARHGIKSQLDDLVLSTIPIEQDSRYIQALGDENDKDDAEQKAKEEAEAKAKLEAEQKAKEKQEKADEALKEKLRKEIIKQAKKEKRDFAEGDLEKEVEEAFAKAKAEENEGKN